MSYNNNCILNMLEIKDKNIIFDDNFCKDEIINGMRSKVYCAKLSYRIEKCDNCGSNILHKHGSITTLNKIVGRVFNEYLKLNKQRYKCQECNKTYTCKTDIIKENCYISELTKLAIFVDLRKKKSLTDIAKDFNVSTSTVSRVLDKLYDNHKLDFNYLPQSLCFDEFKSTKNIKGKMSFIYCDAKTSEIIDILEDRKLDYLIKYFMYFTVKARMGVKRIVIDMYSPYISLIKTCFPNAKIVIDKFHVVQLVNRSFNKTRIDITKKFKGSKYTRLKKYWKLLLKNSEKLNDLDFWYCHSFKYHVSEQYVVNYLLSLSEELSNAYEFYQKILFVFESKDVTSFYQALNYDKTKLSDVMVTSLKTLKKYKDYIVNTIFSDISNGRIEGINNKIKVIKRIAFGYRAFYNFRARIFIIASKNLPIRCC